jgi:DeoR C terminal sensor domain
MPENKPLTVATNSVPLANAVLSRRGLKLLMVGGAVDADLGASVDADAVLAVQRMNIDHCFLGACALSSELGLGGFNLADTLDKLETRAPHVISPLEFIHELVAPHGTLSHVLAVLAKPGATVLTADGPAPSRAATGL